MLQSIIKLLAILTVIAVLSALVGVQLERRPLGLYSDFGWPFVSVETGPKLRKTHSAFWIANAIVCTTLGCCAVAASLLLGRFNSGFQFSIKTCLRLVFCVAVSIWAWQSRLTIFLEISHLMGHRTNVTINWRDSSPPIFYTVPILLSYHAKTMIAFVPAWAGLFFWGFYAVLAVVAFFIARSLILCCAKLNNRYVFWLRWFSSGWASIMIPAVFAIISVYFLLPRLWGQSEVRAAAKPGMPFSRVVEKLGRPSWTSTLRDGTTINGYR